MFVFIKFAPQCNCNMCQYLFVCLYVIIVFKASRYLVTYQVKFSEPVQVNDNNLPVVKVGNFVNKDTIKKNDNGNIAKLNAAMKGSIKYKFIR